MVLISAGRLHWYFFMRKRLGTELKFDKREMAKGNCLWSFSNQVHDNMFHSLVSGLGFLTLFSALTMWLMAKGYAPTITPLGKPVWFTLSLILLPIWSAFHFYWMHRFLHVPFLYTHVHLCIFATSTSARGRAFPCILLNIFSIAPRFAFTGSCPAIRSL